MDPSAAVTFLLPDDVIASVLSRLPARSLAASRQVCKAWRAMIDEQQLLLPHLLPNTVHGIFINYIDYRRPHLFARPTSTPGPSCRLDGKFSFVDREKPWEWYRVQDHCNGLVLRSADDFNGDNMYVINPATRRWAHLPPCGEDHWDRRAFIVFDPAVSPHYQVLLAPTEEEGKPLPPSSWTWHVLSSTTKTWEERVFVREGEAAPPLAGLLPPPPEYDQYDTRWRFAAYWQGALYVHCYGEFVSRLSLSNDTYMVIKSPVELAECNEGVRSFIGKSKDGVYFAALDSKARLRIWILSESADKRTTEWLLKHQSALNPRRWSTETRKKGAEQQRTCPWTLEVYDDTKVNKDAFDDDDCKQDWDSDEDYILDIPNNEEDDGYHHAVDFLGFHPYKEVIFLDGSCITVAFHFNNAKVQYLGQIYLTRTYNRGFFESFVYTPCLIGD